MNKILYRRGFVLYCSINSYVNLVYTSTAGDEKIISLVNTQQLRRIII